MEGYSGHPYKLFAVDHFFGSESHYLGVDVTRGGSTIPGVEFELNEWYKELFNKFLIVSNYESIILKK